MNEESARLLAALDTTERQITAAIRLGQRLLQAPHPERPIYEIEVRELHTRPSRYGLQIWAKPQEAGSVESWAKVLGGEVGLHPNPSTPTAIHHEVSGELEDVPLSVWTVVETCITEPQVVGEERGWSVRYRQGDVQRSVTVDSLEDGQAWVRTWAHVS
jgi:hypothetical protein